MAYYYSTDERIAAALAHMSILLNPFTLVGGPIAAGIIYLGARERSTFVAEQAGQALMHQLTVWALTLGAGLGTALTGGGGIPCLAPLGALLWMWAIWSSLRAARACLKERKFRRRGLAPK
jgi:uncharacterized Tic20 family protein